MHELFAEKGGMGQTELFKVLHAYSVYNPKVGYCQVQNNYTTASVPGTLAALRGQVVSASRFPRNRLSSCF